MNTQSVNPLQELENNGVKVQIEGDVITLNIGNQDPEDARSRVNNLIRSMFAKQASRGAIITQPEPDTTKKDEISALLREDPVTFLKKITYDFAPETTILAGPAVASPEHNPVLKPESLAYEVFEEKTPVHETAVEADRTFTGLLLYRAARIYKDSKPDEFPKLNDVQYAELVKFTDGIVKDENDEEVMLYALAAQDLGKTLEIMDHHTRLFTESARDHDHLLYELNRDHPELFPGFQGISTYGQQLYLQGLDGDLNLGQMVQGENLPCNLTKMMTLDPKVRAIRLLTEFYDFAGATGHVKPGVSILVDNDNFFAYRAAIDALQQDNSLSAYANYIAQRGIKTGLINPKDNILSDTEQFALCRLAALSRSFDEEKGEHIKRAWSNLRKSDRDLLTYEMSLSGLDPERQRGVLVYYSPGMIANAIKSTNSVEKGMTLSLKALANTYRATRRIVSENGKGQTTMDINNLAVLASTDPEKIAAPVQAKPEGPFKRLTLDLDA